MSYSNDGLFFICDTTGKIISIKYIKNYLKYNDLKGKMFIDLFTPESMCTALNFLTDIKKRTASFSWELFIKPEISEYTPQYFSGVINEGEIYIFASPCQINFTKFLDAISLINSEQINLIRDFSKQQNINTPYLQDNGNILDELSKLNNELVNMQREISKSNEKLQELLKLNNYLLGMAAHDLRNPIGSISNYCEFLEESDCSEEQTEFVKEIKYLSNFMLGLLSDILNVSTIESGNISLNKEDFDITSFLTKIIKRQRMIAEQKNIAIIFNCEDSININTDKNKIEQVFTNLLTNAIKFSYPNTTITVVLENLHKSILVKVIDQGQGIASDELKLLFKPFQKTSAKSTAGEPSTGLGLFIVKRIVEACSGKIWVESELNKGTTFFVEFTKS